ncbi:MAG TPA: coproporphyrinogen dehydrogenase HemZ [Clostridiales bacterium]|nr:coproporphyrinogen dehydrogenase HemZ [Clostridiales bacterium]
MIDIYVSNERYENDVYSLVKSFYPGVEVSYNRNDNDLLNQGKLSVIEKEGIKLYIYIENDRLISLKLFLSEEDKITREYKKTYQRLIYKELSKITGKELPWGILTGIRPAKLIYEKIEDKKTDKQIIDFMKETYICSEEKTKLSLQIAKREIELLSEFDYKNGYSLYIGIPFCPTTCLYCSFTSYSIKKYLYLVDDYLLALEKEIIYASTCMKNKELNTIYIGGGTPTTLNEEQLEKLLVIITNNFDIKALKEFSVEAGRPDSITYEKLMILKRYNVSRISINPQTMVQRTLNLIGRNHTAEQIIDAFNMARDIGHKNINMDLIIGLSGETTEDVAYTLNEINKLNPDSITVHTLALKRAAKLNIEKDNYKRYNASGISKMLELTMDYALTNNYLPYYLYRQKNMAENLENIGYARCGKEGLYNILIMEEKQIILALGAGGMSKFVLRDQNRIVRVDNVKSVVDYIDRIDEMIERKETFIREELR